jgi:hypothetical protein
MKSIKKKQKVEGGSEKKTFAPVTVAKPAKKKDAKRGKIFQ